MSSFRVPGKRAVAEIRRGDDSETLGWPPRATRLRPCDSTGVGAVLRLALVVVDAARNDRAGVRVPCDSLPRRGGRAVADGRVDQRVRRPARARPRRPRADPHRELARGRSRGIAVRRGGGALPAELRHRPKSSCSFDPDVVLAGTYTSPFTRTMLRAWATASSSSSPRRRSPTSSDNVRLVARRRRPVRSAANG